MQYNKIGQTDKIWQINSDNIIGTQCYSNTLIV